MYAVLVAVMFIGGWVGTAITTALAVATVYPHIVKPGRWPAFQRAIPGRNKCLPLSTICTAIMHETICFVEMHCCNML
jgi:hypothetical protein